MLRRFALPLATAFIVLILVYFAFLRAAAHDRVDEGEGAPAGAAATPPGAAPAAPPSATPAEARVRRVDKATAEQLRRDIQAARERRRVAAAPRATSTGSGAADSAAPTLDKDYVRMQVRALLPLLAECYTHALERDPKLAGELVVHFDIVGEPEVGGSVDGSEIVTEGSTITDPEMLECVRETMYGLELAAPPAGGIVSITYPFAFAPDDGEGKGPDAGARKEAK